MRSAKATNVDLERWANDYLERIGRTSHRNRSSMAIRSALHSREAPAPRRESRSNASQGPAPHAPTRRPSVTPDNTSNHSSDRHERAAPPPPPFPTRTASQATRPPINSRPSHERADSIAASPSIEQHYQNRAMPPPPPPSGRPGRPHVLNKAFTESSAISTREAEREKEKLERERQTGTYARQGTIGIGFEGSGSPRELPPAVGRDVRDGGHMRTVLEVRDGRASPRDPWDGRGSPRDPRDGRGSPGDMRDRERERERRRMPPPGPMSTQPNGAPVMNGWETRSR